MEAVTAQQPSDKPASGEGIYVYCIIESADPKFDRHGTTGFLRGLGATGVYDVEL